MKRIIAVFIFCLFLLAMPHVVGAEDWPNFRKDTVHSGSVSESLQPPLTLKWQYKTEGKILSSPSVANGKVFIGSRDNQLYALDATSGDIVWKFETEKWIDSSPAVDEAQVYFTSRDGHLYCVNIADGSLKWKHNTGGSDFSSPVISDGKVFAGAGFPTNLIYAVDQETGQRLWQKEAEQAVYSSPALWGNNVYIGANDSKIYCLNKSTGELVWEYKTRGGIYMASPVIDGDKVYIAAGDSDWSVLCLKADTGELVWEHEIEDIQVTPTYVSSVAASGDSIFVVSGYAVQYLYCLNASSGVLKWKKELSSAVRYGFSSSACLAEDIVYVVSAKGQLTALDMATGTLIWEHDMAEDVLSSCAISNSVLYVGTLDGTVYAYE